MSPTNGTVTPTGSTLGSLLTREIPRPMRLDEQFSILPNDPVAPTFRRLMPVLEFRFQSLENQRPDFELAIRELRDASINRIDDVLGPAVEKVAAYTSLGWFMVRSKSDITLTVGADRMFLIDEGIQRDLFTPTPFLAIQRQSEPNDYAFVRLNTYHAVGGFLHVRILSVWGNPGPHNDWVITSTPGIAEATKYWFEQTLALGNKAEQEADRATAQADRAEANADRSQVNRDWMDDVRQSIEQAGLDPTLFAWRDGTRPFTAVVAGIAPAGTANDASLVTAAWVRTHVAAAGLATNNPTFTGTLTGPNANFTGTVTLAGTNLTARFAPIASPNFTGTISLGGTNIATIYAPLANPNFTGVIRVNGSPLALVANVPVSFSPPGNPADGELWFDSGKLETFIRYNDGTTTQWIPASGGASGGVLGAMGDVRSFTVDNRGLEIIRKLQPVDFDPPQETRRGRRPTREMSFSAQEVADLIPEAAVTIDSPVGPPTLGFKPTALIAVCVNALKELDARVTKLET